MSVKPIEASPVQFPQPQNDFDLNSMKGLKQSVKTLFIDVLNSSAVMTEDVKAKLQTNTLQFASNLGVVSLPDHHFGVVAEKVQKLALENDTLKAELIEAKEIIEKQKRLIAQLGENPSQLAASSSSSTTLPAASSSSSSQASQAVTFEELERWDSAINEFTKPIVIKFILNNEAVLKESFIQVDRFILQSWVLFLKISDNKNSAQVFNQAFNSSNKTPFLFGKKIPTFDLDSVKPYHDLAKTVHQRYLGKGSDKTLIEKMLANYNDVKSEIEKTLKAIPQPNADANKGLSAAELQVEEKNRQTFSRLNTQLHILNSLWYWISYRNNDSTSHLTELDGHFGVKPIGTLEGYIPYFAKILGSSGTENFPAVNLALPQVQPQPQAAAAPTSSQTIEEFEDLDVK